MRVELLFWAGCPSYGKALRELQDVLRESGHDPEAVVVGNPDRLVQVFVNLLRNALYAVFLGQAPRLVAGITRTLDELHGKYVMGVVTSSRKDHFDVIHRSSGLLKYFDFVLTASDFSRVKPDPDPYLRAVERSGVAPQACVAIEDSERGQCSKSDDELAADDDTCRRRGVGRADEQSQQGRDDERQQQAAPAEHQGEPARRGWENGGIHGPDDSSDFARLEPPCDR